MLFFFCTSNIDFCRYRQNSDRVWKEVRIFYKFFPVYYFPHSLCLFFRLCYEAILIEIWPLCIILLLLIFSLYINICWLMYSASRSKKTSGVVMIWEFIQLFSVFVNKGFKISNHFLTYSRISKCLSGRKIKTNFHSSRLESKDFANFLKTGHNLWLMQPI